MWVEEVRCADKTKGESIEAVACECLHVRLRDIGKVLRSKALRQSMCNRRDHPIVLEGVLARTL